MSLGKHATPFAVLATAFGFILAPTAQARPDAAAPPTAYCAPGWLCGYTDVDYAGVASLTGDNMPFYPETTAYVGFNGGLSVWNGSGTWKADGRLWGRCATVYSKVGYTGQSRTIRPNQGIRSLPASFGHIRSNRFHNCPLS